MNNQLNFKIEIGQDQFRMSPPMICFIANEHYLQMKLEDLKNWINTIWDSQGDRNSQAYKAKDKLTQTLGELFHYVYEDGKTVGKGD